MAAKKSARKIPAKKAAPVKRPTKKPTTKPASKPLVVTQKTTIQQAKNGERTTFDPEATVLLTDKVYSASVIEAMKAEWTVEKIIQGFRELCNATYETKHGEERIDHRTRLTALEKIAHYVIGKPLDRIQNVETKVWDTNELDEMIAHSPNLRSALWEMLAPYEGERAR